MKQYEHIRDPVTQSLVPLASSPARVILKQYIHAYKRSVNQMGGTHPVHSQRGGEESGDATTDAVATEEQGKPVAQILGHIHNKTRKEKFSENAKYSIKQNTGLKWNKLIKDGKSADGKSAQISAEIEGTTYIKKITGARLLGGTNSVKKTRTKWVLSLTDAWTQIFVNYALMEYADEEYKPHITQSLDWKIDSQNRGAQILEQIDGTLHESLFAESSWLYATVNLSLKLQTFDILCHLQEKCGFCHGDLKPKNIFC